MARKANQPILMENQKVLASAYHKRTFKTETIVRRFKRRGETKEPLPASIRAAAIDYLQRSNHHSKIMAPMGFSLRCCNNLTRLIYDKFPMADLFWEFNGQPLRVDLSRTWYEPLKNELTMLVGRPEDSGVYACKMAQNWYWEQTVEFFVIHVQSFKPTLSPREWEAITLRCNSESLDDLFLDPNNRTWLHNGTIVFNAAATEGETMTVDHTKPEDGGIWECLVTNSGRKWLTSQVNVSVLPPLSLWERILSQKKYTVGAIVLVAIGCTVLFFIFFGLAYWSDKRDREERLYFEEQLEFLKKQRQGGT